jgi:RimJ/RimL family protein N-acetyltransferase
MAIAADTWQTSGAGELLRPTVFVRLWAGFLEMLHHPQSIEQIRRTSGELEDTECPPQKCEMQVHSKRLTLREIEGGDLDAVLAYRERSQQSRSRSVPSGINADWLNNESGADGAGTAPDEIRLAVFVTSENKLVGICRVRFTDSRHHSAEVLFDFDPLPQLEGLAREAAAAVIWLGFEKLRLQRISSWCLSRDSSMAGILEEVGMQVETVVPRSRWIQGQWWDTSVYSIHKDEWAIQCGT